jgi:hypothetical protein
MSVEGRDWFMSAESPQAPITTYFAHQKEKAFFLEVVYLQEGLK